MSDFYENLSIFMRECRNVVLAEACDNKEYVRSKEKCAELQKRLLSSVPAEHNSLLGRFLDDRYSIGVIESSYCYLCGLRDGNATEIDFNPTAHETPPELAAYERYASLKSKSAEQYELLRTLLSAECFGLLDECVKAKDFILGIEKTYCYPGGLRDKKQLDKQFNPSADKEWCELMKAFL